jgi:hypothetical protein
MKSMEELANAKTEEQNVNEALVYDDIIKKLNEAKENGTPIDEGIFGAIGGAVIGAAIGPKLGAALCRALGVDPKGTFGSLLTSKLLLGSIGASMGWKI